jgi:hypothetical protein
MGVFTATLHRNGRDPDHIWNTLLLLLRYLATCLWIGWLLRKRVTILLLLWGRNGSDGCLCRLETVGTLPGEEELVVYHSCIVRYLLLFCKWNVCCVWVSSVQWDFLWIHLTFLRDSCQYAPDRVLFDHGARVFQIDRQSYLLNYKFESYFFLSL